MAMTPGTAKPPARLDIATFGGLVVAAAAILGGLVLEGGSLLDIAQVTAALIVFGGTLGAVMVHTPLHVLRGALKRLRGVILEPKADAATLIEEIVKYAASARKHGVVSLETEIPNVTDSFFRKALMLAVVGADLQELRQMMELEIAQREQRGEAEAKVFESAGGYAPTIGIIGAVMGLIQVMKHLEDIKEVGHGIAVAFVATIYGVALANIVFLPAAHKIKARLACEAQLQELILEGVLGITEGMNPKLLRSKLEAYQDAPSSQSQSLPSAAEKAA